MPGKPTLVLNIRLPMDLKLAVEAVLEANRTTGEGARTITGAVTEALQAWLATRGMPLTAEVTRAVQQVRPVGRPKKPPYTWPEGADAVAAWRTFWTIAYTKGWTNAAQWAINQSGTDIDSWDRAVRAALPEDVRPTREELGLPSEREWIEAQVAAALGPKPGKEQQ